MKITKPKNRIIAHETKKDLKTEGHHFSSNKEILKEQIEKKAYELYEGRGCMPGRELEDWFEAERIVNSEGILT